VGLLAQMPFVVAVRENAGVNTLPQFVAKAKASGTRLNFGSAGVGSVNHVVTELFSKTAGVQMVNVPYRGMGEAIAGLLGGSVDVLVTAMPTAMGQVKSGRIRALAVTAPARSPALPEVPTTSEAGVKFEASNWIGLTAPRNTPPEALAWMQKALATAVATPEVKQIFLRQGAEAAAEGTRESFEHLLRSETARWAEVIRAAKITPEQ
jgi:tripartite-type tricarboxylate transporter receptor subunit TctC